MGEVREKRKLGLWIAAALFLLAAIIVVALRITTVTVSEAQGIRRSRWRNICFRILGTEILWSVI